MLKFDETSNPKPRCKYDLVTSRWWFFGPPCIAGW